MPPKVGATLKFTIKKLFARHKQIRDRLLALIPDAKQIRDLPVWGTIREMKSKTAADAYDEMKHAGFGSSVADYILDNIGNDTELQRLFTASSLRFITAQDIIDSLETQRPLTSVETPASPNSPGSPRKRRPKTPDYPKTSDYPLPLQNWGTSQLENKPPMHSYSGAPLVEGEEKDLESGLFIGDYKEMIDESHQRAQSDSKVAQVLEGLYNIPRRLLDGIPLEAFAVVATVIAGHRNPKKLALLKKYNFGKTKILGVLAAVSQGVKKAGKYLQNGDDSPDEDDYSEDEKDLELGERESPDEQPEPAIPAQSTLGDKFIKGAAGAVGGAAVGAAIKLASEITTDEVDGPAAPVQAAPAAVQAPVQALTRPVHIPDGSVPLLRPSYGIPSAKDIEEDLLDPDLAKFNDDYLESFQQYSQLPEKDRDNPMLVLADKQKKFEESFIEKYEYHQDLPENAHALEQTRLSVRVEQKNDSEQSAYILPGTLMTAYGVEEQLIDLPVSFPLTDAQEIREMNKLMFPFRSMRVKAF